MRILTKDVLMNVTLILTIAAVLTILFIPEAFAFGQPIVNKIDSVTQIGLGIAKAVAGLGLLWFLINMGLGHVNYRQLICTTIAGACTAGFTYIYKWLVS